jgi:hypothetical protein
LPHYEGRKVVSVDDSAQSSLTKPRKVATITDPASETKRIQTLRWRRSQSGANPVSSVKFPGAGKNTGYRAIFRPFWRVRRPNTPEFLRISRTNSLYSEAGNFPTVAGNKITLGGYFGCPSGKSPSAGLSRPRQVGNSRPSLGTIGVCTTPLPFGPGVVTQKLSHYRPGSWMVREHRRRYSLAECLRVGTRKLTEQSMARDEVWFNLPQAVVLEATRDIDLVPPLASGEASLVLQRANHILAQQASVPLEDDAPKTKRRAAYKRLQQELHANRSESRYLAAERRLWALFARGVTVKAAKEQDGTLEKVDPAEFTRLEPRGFDAFARARF